VGGYGLPLALSAGNLADSMQLQPAGQPEDGGVYAGCDGVAVELGLARGMEHTNMHPAASAACTSAMWGQQLPLQQQQQQLGFDDDGLVSFEQLQHFELQPVQFGGAAPMDFTPGVSQGIVAMPGLDFE
jgi:hypothetical protein